MISFAIIFALLLGGFVFLVLPRGRFWWRAVSASLYVVLLGLVYGGAVEMLGQPKPVRLEWRGDMAEADLLGASLKEGQAIYVLLQFPDGAAPRYYEFPWSQKMAEQIQKAQREGQANGTGVKMKTAKGQSGRRSPRTDVLRHAAADAAGQELRRQRRHAGLSAAGHQPVGLGLPVRLTTQHLPVCE